MSDQDDGKTPALCWKCGPLGRYKEPQDAANAELLHQQVKHPVQLQGKTGNASTAGWKTVKYDRHGKAKPGKDEPKKKGK